MNSIKTSISQPLFNPVLEQGNDVVRIVALAAGLVKNVTGVTNFISYYTMLDAMDHLKKHPAFRMEIKKSFRTAMDMYFDYEKKLRYSSAPRFFCVDDIPAEYRNRYKSDLTDSEYFEMWRDVGASSYSKYSKELKVLYWKYRKSIESHGVKYADIISYVLLAGTSLMMSFKFLSLLLQRISDETGISIKRIDLLFGSFKLDDVYAQWEKSVRLLEGKIDTKFNLSPAEDRNIYLGMRQLERAITADLLKMDGMRDAMELNRDKFASKYEYRLAVSEINSISASDDDVEEILG